MAENLFIQKLAVTPLYETIKLILDEIIAEHERKEKEKIIKTGITKLHSDLKSN